jgi:hypothetical protein
VVARLSAWGSWTVRAARVAPGPSEDQVRTVRVFGCPSGRSVAINGPSTRGQRTVRPVTAGRPPQGCGLSARVFAGQLSPLLL